jgi:hypothetical protein
VGSGRGEERLGCDRHGGEREREREQLNSNKVMPARMCPQQHGNHVPKHHMLTLNAHTDTDTDIHTHTYTQTEEHQAYLERHGDWCSLDGCGVWADSTGVGTRSLKAEKKKERAKMRFSRDSMNSYDTIFVRQRSLRSHDMIFA